MQIQEDVMNMGSFLLRCPGMNNLDNRQDRNNQFTFALPMHACVKTAGKAIRHLRLNIS